MTSVLVELKKILFIFCPKFLKLYGSIYSIYNFFLFDFEEFKKKKRDCFSFLFAGDPFLRIFNSRIPKLSLSSIFKNFFALYGDFSHCYLLLFSKNLTPLTVKPKFRKKHVLRKTITKVRCERWNYDDTLAEKFKNQFSFQRYFFGLKSKAQNFTRKMRI